MVYKTVNERVQEYVPEDWAQRGIEVRRLYSKDRVNCLHYGWWAVFPDLIDSVFLGYNAEEAMGSIRYFAEKWEGAEFPVYYDSQGREHEVF